MVRVSRCVHKRRRARVMSACVKEAPPHCCLSGMSFKPRSGCTRVLMGYGASRLSHRLRAQLRSSVSLGCPRPLVGIGGFRLDPLARTIVRTHFLNPSPTMLSSLIKRTVRIVQQGPGMTSTHGR